MFRARRRLVAGGLASIAAAATGLTLSGPALAAPADTSASTAVIVVLRDQLPGAPADAGSSSRRAGAAHGQQAAVLARLRGPKPSKVINYTTGNALAATVTAQQAAALAADPAVASVVPDTKVEVAPPAAKAGAAAAAPSAGARAATPAVTGPSPVDPAACSSDPANPKLEPEALQTINARSQDQAAKTAAALGIDGSGVRVGYIADGINPANQAFRRTDGRSSVVDYKDFYGDGPDAVTSGAEAFGDAGAISAQGNVVYDVADYANPAVVSFPGGHCYIKVVGVAPGADVVALKAGSELLPNSAILQSIDYAVSVAHVDVLNESFGANLTPDDGARNTIALFNDQAVAAGVSVTVSTGDAGISSTIGNPSTDPNVISTGATTDSRLYEQTGYALATRFGNGRWQDSNTSALSSAGITQGGRTIDLSAPGEADWAPCDSSGRFVGCTSFGNPAHPYADIQAFGGTSQSAPITAGAAALVIQAYRGTHGGTSPAPAVVKQILISTARDLGLPGEQQGSGLLDARAAVEAALTWPGATTPAPAGVASNVALSAGQLHLEGAPGTTQTGSFSVTNVGTTTQSVVVNTRRSALLASAQQDVALSTASTQTVPYPTTGKPWVYQKVTFSVPAGADELAATIRWQSGAAPGGAGPVVRLSLFAPDGTYASNTRPQGGGAPANYGLVTIRQPAAGTWTGILYTPATGGYTGTVSLTDQAFRSLPVGSVHPGLTRLEPGQSTTVKVSVPVPATGGDTAYTASVGSSGGHQTAVPVIARAIVPTASGTGSFAGTITGGNARGGAPAQTFSYAFDVPKGKRDLTVTTTLATDPGDLLQGVLVAPNGEVSSINSNNVNGAQGRSMQNTVATPLAGRWRFVVNVQSPVSGKELTEDFTGTVAFDRQAVSGFSLPKRLPGGRPTTVAVTVVNTGLAPMVVQTDARRNGLQQVQLAPQFAGSTLKLPQSVEDLSQLPAYLVPPGTQRVDITASSTSPAQVELNSPGGGIDVFGDLRTAQGGDTVSTATVQEKGRTVGLGYWSTYVQQIGPFGNGGAPAATSVLTATAQTQPFDTAVNSSTGDPFLTATDPTQDPGTPVIIAPGASAVIQVTIIPQGKKGTTVKGVLNIVTTPLGVANLFNTTGEVLAALPYQYTVGR